MDGDDRRRRGRCAADAARRSGCDRRDRGRGDGRAVVKARVRVAPFDGEANAALCRLIASTVGVAPRDASIAAGATSRIKRVRIQGQAAPILAALRSLITEDE